MFSNANSLKSKIMNMAIDFDVLRKALGNTVEKRGSKEAIDVWESQLIVLRLMSIKSNFGHVIKDNSNMHKIFLLRNQFRLLENS